MIPNTTNIYRMSFKEINFRVMTDTVEQCENHPGLKQAIQNSIERQYVVKEGTNIEVPERSVAETKIVLTGHRTFEAARQYKGKRVAVLNFANNHSIGGAPFSAGAQEESLCRCSTLYPCLKANYETFYKPHIEAFHNKSMTAMGNDDLIYTPGVIVFKSDESEPKMLSHDLWYAVNVITSAAPECYALPVLPDNYRRIIRSRLKQVLDVAAAEGNEVLILGAWGCGAFRNPTYTVATVFKELLKEYTCFEIVEFAIGNKYSKNYEAFERAFTKG